MENPTKMDDLGVPLFSETSIYKWGIPWAYNPLTTYLFTNISWGILARWVLGGEIAWSSSPIHFLS